MGFNSQKYNSLDELQPPQVTMNDSEKRDVNLVLSGDDLKRLLRKGLRTKDKTLLKSVFCKIDEKLITKALQDLPPKLILKLVKTLSDQLDRTHAKNTEIIFLWFKCLCETHETIVLENPPVVEALQHLNSIVDHRISLQVRLNELKGRLDLLVHHAESSQNKVDDQEPTIIFNDEVEEFETASNDDDLRWNGEYTDEEMEVEDDADTDT